MHTDDRLKLRLVDLVIDEIYSPDRAGRFSRFRDRHGLENKIHNLHSGLGKSDVEGWKHRTFGAGDMMPRYRPMTTNFMYKVLKKYGSETFSKINITGEVDKVLEQSKAGGLVILPTHNDMFDTVLVAYPFLEAGLKPPVFHAGANLMNAISSTLLPWWNVLFVKRRGLDDLDHLIYAKQIHLLLEEGESQTIYPEATRSRYGFLAPVNTKERFLFGKALETKGMAKGYIDSLLLAKKRGLDVYTTAVTVSTPLFPDVMKYMKTSSRESKMLLIWEYFKNVRNYKGEIYVHYSKPEPLPNTNAINFSASLRRKLRSNITVLPENVLAYAMKCAMLDNEGFNELPDRGDVLRNLYEDLTGALDAENKAVSDFDSAASFYMDTGTLGSDMTIRPDYLMEYNSNRIQHFFRKSHPLPKK